VGLVVIGFVVLLVLGTGGLMFGTFARKRRRRRRRRDTGSERQRIVGAWHELGDKLHARGLRWTPAQTTKEVAAAASQVWGSTIGSAVSAVSECVDNAIFGNHEVWEEDVAQVWLHVGEIEVAIDRTRTRGQRIASALGWSVR
jgi:hypothetical protein